MPKIILRKYRMSDLDRMCELFIDKNVLANFPDLDINNVTRKMEKKWLKGTINSYRLKKPKSMYMAIFVDGTYIGGIGMDNAKYAHEKVEVGYFIGHKYWGKGYATAALRQFLKLLFKRFKFKRIEGHAFSHNIGSQKVMLKNGFKYEGEKKKAIKKNGRFYNQKFYALVK